MTQYCSRCQRFIAAVEGKCSQCGNPVHGTSGSGYFISRGFPGRPHVHLEPGTRLVGDRFAIGDCLGQGGFGTVYLAQDTVRSEQVALKIVSLGPESPDDAALQLRQEAALHTRITDYRHVIRVHDIHFQPWSGIGLLILSMEYADGGTLRAWLLKHRNDWRTRRSQGAAYFTQLCTGIAAFHEAGIVHGDLKPENALFCGPVLKVADFGSARLAQMLQSTQALALPPAAETGTLTYSSPEQILAAHPDDVDCRSDIYALGVILHEIIHPKGRTPFGGSPKRLRELHVEVAAPPVPDVTPTEARVVERCLAKNPSDRYESVSELIDDLEGRTLGSLAGPLPADLPDTPDAEESVEQLWTDVQTCLCERDLSGAHRLCKSILDLQADHPEAQAVLADLSRRFDKAQQFYQAIERELDHRPLRELAALVTEAVDIYPEHPSGHLVQMRLLSRADEYRDTMHQAVEALREGRWEAALSLFQNAQRLNAGAAGVSRAITFLSDLLDNIRTMRGYIDEAIRERNVRRALGLARELDEQLENVRIEMRST